MQTQSQSQSQSSAQPASLPLSGTTVGFGLALALCSVLNVVLTVVKEKNPAVLAEMKKLAGHHWVAHAGIIVLLFVVVGLVLGRLNGGRGPVLSAGRLFQTILGGAILGGMIIVGFYLLAD